MKLIGAFNETGNTPGPVLPEVSATQTFVSPLANLSRIEIMPTDGGPNQDVVLELTLSKRDADQIVATSSAVVAKGQTDSFVAFEFEPQSDSADTDYAFTITAQQDQSSTEPVIVKQSLANAYYQGELLINDQPNPADLVFRTYHHQPTSLTSVLLTSFQKHWQADPVFLSLWGALISMILFLLSRQLVRLLKK